MAKRASVLPETVGSDDRPEDPIGDLIKKSHGVRGLPFAKANKEVGKVFKSSPLYSGKLPKTGPKTKAKAAKAKAAASGDFYNRGQRQSKNIEDATTATASDPGYGTQLYSKSPGFFKHKIVNN